MPSTHGALWQSSFIPQSIPVIDHPLRIEPKVRNPFIFKTEDTSKKDDEEVFSDPLNVHNSVTTISNSVFDLKPVTNHVDGPLKNTLLDNSTSDSYDNDPDFIGFKPWKEYRQQIQDLFHGKDLLSLETSFIKTSTTRQNKKKMPTDDVQIGVLHDLSEEEYKRRFADLNRILHQLWQDDNRLECIKLCREVASSLSSSQAPRFYPQKFVLVTDLLETFGRLVFERLHRKANEERIANRLDPLLSNFTTIDILEKTRITARNWFGKVSEIRDVIPRIFIGACLMPCMKFMDESAISDNVIRLCVLACSLQHPLTSSYARCYICRISMRLMPSNRAPHWKCLHDWIQNHQQQPTAILWPALEYILQCVAYEAVTYDDLLPLWEYAKLPEKRSYMLKAMFNALPPLYLSEHAVNACKLLTSSEHISCDEIRAFGEGLLKTTVFEQNRRFILKSVWKHIKAMSSLKSFLDACEVWIEFGARYFDISHVHFMMETIVERLPDRKFEQNMNVLVAMIKRVVRSINNVAELIDPDVFPRFFQMFTNKELAKKMSSIVLNGLIDKHGLASLNDATLGYQVIDLCKCIHDTITIQTDNNTVNESVNLICRALDRFELKSVPEQGLSFFVACRASLLNLNECQQYVIGRIFELGLYVVSSARFSTARSAFVQACVANAYITVPSLPDPSTRIRIFIRSGELALASMAFLQVDSFVEACLREFQTFPGNRQQQFCLLLSEFLAFLLAIPIVESNNCLSAYNSVFESIKRYEWQTSKCIEHEHGNALLSCLRFLFSLRDMNSNSDGNTQFMWSMNGSNQLDIDPLFINLYEQLSLIIQEESDKRPLLSVLFLENLASFSGQIDQTARLTAKLAYKKCKNAEQSIVDRMASIQFK